MGHKIYQFLLSVLKTQNQYELQESSTFYERTLEIWCFIREFCFITALNVVKAERKSFTIIVVGISFTIEDQFISLLVSIGCGKKFAASWFMNLQTEFILDLIYSAAILVNVLVVVKFREKFIGALINQKTWVRLQRETLLDFLFLGRWMQLSS